MNCTYARITVCSHAYTSLTFEGRCFATIVATAGGVEDAKRLNLQYGSAEP